jgi:hypothetical protein
MASSCAALLLTSSAAGMVQALHHQRSFERYVPCVALTKCKNG